MTKTEKLIRGILAHGYVEVISRSGKYRTFYSNKDGVRFRFLFVGKSAAVRASANHYSSHSFALTERTKQTFLEAA